MVAVSPRSPLLAVAAEVSGACAEEVRALAAKLLNGPGRATARSRLNNDGTPLQVCLTAKNAGSEVRLLADPGAHARSSRERVALARAALESVLGPVATLREVCWRVLETVLPPAVERSPVARNGVLWLAAPLSAPGLGLYVKAHWGEEPAADWDRCAAVVGDVLPSPGQGQETIAALRAIARPVSLALEGADPARARLKLYWRLTEPAALSSLGIDLLGDSSIVDFLRCVLSGRDRVAATGLVFSASFLLRSGEISDAKVDVCGHCVDRASAEWLGIVRTLVASHAPAQPELERVLEAGRAEVAFIGLGLDGLGQRRLNVYLKAPSRQRAALGRTDPTHADSLTA